tara:strand:+ start:138 stop:776 length:639 start_codon:yes stop_codon:yes gene_type:complete
MSKKLTKNRLQLERRVLPQSLINTLHDIVANPKSAQQAAKTYGGTANRDVRDTTLFEFNDKSHPKEVERVRKSFESYFENEKLNQCDLLYYGKGQHFSLHRDNDSKDPTANVGGAGRNWSCSTLIHQSEDLEGGDLLVYGPFSPERRETRPRVIRLNIGQSVFFPSHWYHEVTPVTKGERIVLVSWLGDNPQDIPKLYEKEHLKRERKLHVL